MMRRIFLIGYMGSGKSTIGKRIAQAMNLQFVDLDLFIEGRYLKTIAQLFTEKGEEEFRQIEANALREVARFENVLISTGGGTPCFHHNMEFMNNCGTTVYIQTEVEILFNRLKKAKSKRPIIAQKTDEELLHFIQTNLRQREPFYLQATLHLHSMETSTKHEIIDEILHNYLQQINNA